MTVVRTPAYPEDGAYIVVVCRPVVEVIGAYPVVAEGAIGAYMLVVEGAAGAYLVVAEGVAGAAIVVTPAPGRWQFVHLELDAY
jgi:hypothetical protein